jgi:phage terminase large subunit-like protein
LLNLCGPEAEPHAQLYSAAQSRDQAALVFNLAAKIVRLSPGLSEIVSIRDTAKELLCRQIGTRYKALSSESKTAFGLSPRFIVHDELGQVRSSRSELYEALETATGAQIDPLSVIISTQAPTDADLLSLLIDDALQANDPHTTVSLHSAPFDAEPFELSTIALANPALGDFLNEEEVMSMAAAAQRMPSREAQYRNLILNQRVEASAPFITRSTWASCAEPVQPIDGVPVYGGLDLSETRDLTALVLIGQVGGKWQVHPTFWLPAEGLREKARTDRVPYDVWARQGKLCTCPGKSVDYEYVAIELRKLFDRYKIKKLAFDMWNFRHLKPWLLKAGFTEAMIEQQFEEFGQGWKSMSPALRELESQILQGKLAHGDHPVLSMCAANAVVMKDPANNRKLAKHKSPGRIDGMVALTMAIGVVPVDMKPVPKPGLRIL